MTQHNILHFVCHDLGTCLGCYGDGSIPSPRLDAFAEEGVRFTSYYAAATPCSPSRGCIMSGRYAHSNGLIGLVNRGWNMPEQVTTVVDCLNAAGYHTAHFGFQHERRNPSHNHYAHDWRDSIDAKDVAAQVVAWLENAPRPFYINAGTFEVHLMFDNPAYVPADPASVRVPPYLPDIPEVREELARFHGAIRYMDEAFGMILDALDRTGRRDDTIVIFTTDHGEAFPRAKGTLYDPGIRTALMMRFPEGYRSVHDELLSNIDWMPTLLDAVGVPIPDEVQGRSFLPLIKSEPFAPRDVIFSEKNFHDIYDPVRCARTPQFKYIRSYTDQPGFAISIDILHSVAAKILRPDAKEIRPREELYDLIRDPNEDHNLIDDPHYAQTRREMSDRLDHWMKETGDPLLERVDLPYPPEQFPKK